MSKAPRAPGAEHGRSLDLSGGIVEGDAPVLVVAGVLDAESNEESAELRKLRAEVRVVPAARRTSRGPERSAP